MCSTTWVGTGIRATHPGPRIGERAQAAQDLKAGRREAGRELVTTPLPLRLIALGKGERTIAWRREGAAAAVVVCVHVTLTIVKGRHGKDQTKGRGGAQLDRGTGPYDVMEMDNVSPERKESLKHCGRGGSLTAYFNLGVLFIVITYRRPGLVCCVSQEQHMVGII